MKLLSFICRWRGKHWWNWMKYEKAKKRWESWEGSLPIPTCKLCGHKDYPIMKMKKGA